jgi:hypothetical protein
MQTFDTGKVFQLRLFTNKQQMTPIVISLFFQYGRLTGGSTSNAHNFKIGTHPDKSFASSIAARRDSVSIKSAINCNHPQKPVIITRYSPATNDITQHTAHMPCFGLVCHFSTNHIYASSFTFLSTLVVSISFPSRTAHG